MRAKNPALVSASLAFLGVFASVSAEVHAQTSQRANATTSSTAEKPYNWKSSFANVPTRKVPRAPNGKPDLQGIWSFSILTPLDRPSAKKNTEIRAAEVEEIEDAAQKSQLNLRVEPTVTPLGEKTTDAYNTFWRDGYWYKVPMTILHTSQVVDPPDGQLPPLTAAAKKRQNDVSVRLNRQARGPEDRPVTSRCIRSLTSGPPFIGSGPGSQETTLEIVQGPDTVVVRESMDSQIIPLDGRARPPGNIHLDKGVARGHWEDDALVVESTNFADWANGFFSGYGTTQRMHLIERWKRLDDTHLLYGFTIDDPGTWTRPWSVEFIMWRLTDQEQLVEYACHAGNVGIEFTLSAARAVEKAGENAAKPTPLASTIRSEGAALVRPSVVASALPHFTNDLGLEFITIPPGEFEMGCSKEAPHEKLPFPTGCSKDEEPRHAVQITKAFEIQTTELTQKQWQSVMGANPSGHKGDLSLPVDQVSFLDVQQFLTKLNARNDGYLYRLPTEAEWEYAARAGTADPYAGSLADTAWYHDDELAANGRGSSVGANGVPLESHPVASKTANSWGLHDMRGNVSEWVQDWYGNDYYSDSLASDPKGPATGSMRVVRGGSYHVYPWLTRVSVRTPFPEAYQFNDLGFRVVREKR